MSNAQCKLFAVFTNLKLVKVEAIGGYNTAAALLCEVEYPAARTASSSESANCHAIRTFARNGRASVLYHAAFAYKSRFYSTKSKTAASNAVPNFRKKIAVGIR